MSTYLVTTIGRLFSSHRLVEAGSKAEAAAAIDQTGVLVMWIDDVTGEDAQ